MIKPFLFVCSCGILFVLTNQQNDSNNNTYLVKIVLDKLARQHELVVL